MNKVAVGPDCPWLSKGDGSSVASCESSCATVSRCNAFNLNLGTGDCELRACIDPTHPGLTDYTVGWAVWGNAAAPGTTLFNAWHTDTSALAYLCELTPACLGFNSVGDLISNVNSTSSAQGTTLWVRKSALIEGNEMMNSHRISPHKVKEDTIETKKKLQIHKASSASAKMRKRVGRK